MLTQGTIPFGLFNADPWPHQIDKPLPDAFGSEG